MGKIWMPGGGGGADLDVITAGAGDILAGKVIVGPDGEPLTGILELTGSAADSQVLSGKTYYNTDAKTKRTGTMANQGAKTASLNCGGSYTIPAGYHNGSGKVTANSLASQTEGATVEDTDVRKGKTYWKDGTRRTGTMQEKSAETITPGTSNKTIAANQFLTGVQTIKGDSGLVSSNIVAGKSIFGVSGSAVTYYNRNMCKIQNISRLESFQAYMYPGGTLKSFKTKFFTIETIGSKKIIGIDYMAYCENDQQSIRVVSDKSSSALIADDCYGAVGSLHCGEPSPAANARICYQISNPGLFCNYEAILFPYTYNGDLSTKGAVYGDYFAKIPIVIMNNAAQVDFVDDWNLRVHMN